ncbi:hypothetical protein ACLEQD_43680, partial [Corallococcus sp. 4LFB]
MRRPTCCAAARLAVASLRADTATQAQTLKDLGGASEATLVGPFSPFHVLAIDEPIAPEKDGSFAGPFTGAYGALAARTVRSPDGRLDLAGEPGHGDMYALGIDAEVAQAGVYVLRTVSQTSHRVLMDGAPVLERRDWARTASTVSVRALELPAGKHRFVVKMSRDNTQGGLSFALMKADGSPAGVRLTAATGPAPRWDASAPDEVEAPDMYPGAEDLAR